MKNQHPDSAPPKRKRRKYTKEFKQEAVQLARQISVRKAAADLGINATMLSDWSRALNKDGTEAFRGHGKRTVMEAELNRLRKEISVLKQEREILKKAAEFWVKEQT